MKKMGLRMKPIVENTKISTSRGFTLLEVVLGLAVAGSVALVGVQAMKGWAESEKADATASYIEKINDATREMLGGPREFEVFYSLADNAGGTVEIPVYTNDPMEPASVMYGIQGTAGASGTVPGSPRLSRASADMNPLKSPMTLIVRRDGAPGKRELHLALVSGTRIPEVLTRKTASLIGGGSGYVSAVPPTEGACVTACERTIRSAFGEWQVDINTFAGTAWESNVTAEPPSPASGSYLVVYRHVSEDEAEGDYLYRAQIPGNPDANTMYTPVDMAGSSIVGADNVWVGGDLTVRETLSVQGHANIAGDFSTAELVVDGGVFGGTMSISRTFVSDPAKIDETALSTSGTFLVDGTIAAANTGVDNTTGGMVLVDDLFQDSDTGSISADSITMASLQNASGNFNVTGTSHIGNLEIEETLAVDRLITESLTADKVETIDTVIDRNLKIETDLNTSDPVAIENAAFSIVGPPVFPTYEWTSFVSDTCSWRTVDGVDALWCDKATIVDIENPSDILDVTVGDILPDGEIILKIKKHNPGKGVYIDRGGTEILLDRY